MPSCCVSRQLIGRGRYGTVFRGLLGDRCVAVKLFSSANRQTFANERSIYSLPLLQQHANVARFLSAEQRSTTDGRPEFLIVMDFYPQVRTIRVSTSCRTKVCWSLHLDQIPLSVNQFSIGAGTTVSGPGGDSRDLSPSLRAGRGSKSSRVSTWIRHCGVQ